MTGECSRTRWQARFGADVCWLVRRQHVVSFHTRPVIRVSSVRQAMPGARRTSLRSCTARRLTLGLVPDTPAWLPLAPASELPTSLGSLWRDVPPVWMLRACASNWPDWQSIAEQNEERPERILHLWYGPRLLRLWARQPSDRGVND